MIDFNAHPKILKFMKGFIGEFEDMHITCLLKVQGRSHKDLPKQDHMDNRGWSVIYYRKILGYCPGSGCTFHHVPRREFPEPFVIDLWDRSQAGQRNRNVGGATTQVSALG